MEKKKVKCGIERTVVGKSFYKEKIIIFFFFLSALCYHNWSQNTDVKNLLFCSILHEILLFLRK